MDWAQAHHETGAEQFRRIAQGERTLVLKDKDRRDKAVAIHRECGFQWGEVTLSKLPTEWKLPVYGRLKDGSIADY